MVCTDYLTETGEGVLVELAGSLVLAQRMQIAGEVVGRGQGVGVVLPEYPAAVGERPFEQGAGGAGFSPGLQVSSGPVEQPAESSPAGSRGRWESVAASTWGSNARQAGQVGGLPHGSAGTAAASSRTATMAMSSPSVPMLDGWLRRMAWTSRCSCRLLASTRAKPR